MGNPRRTNGSRRTKLRNRVRAEGRPCAICGKPIDYDLPPGHPDSYELDEIVPVSKGGSPYDYDNVQPAHRRCNQIKGAKGDRAMKASMRSMMESLEADARKRKPVRHSREW